ncbi:hypothetical protein [Campylobacter sp. RM16188]|uniref:hypothetical protein n=1 Tax=Campylobacter sp. RM16188 TaxID=1705725 RepID=UPI0015541784|nr:hypothetical protein [Campylobacter sp. RM16188]
MEARMSPMEFGLDYYETLMFRGQNIACVAKQGYNGGYIECDSLILKAFCKRFKIDFIWMIEISKSFIAIINKGIR